ncbi:MAG: AAA family ATPase, partial [Candidatus Micrarchaeota archaeon]|nr:AAA family ATPase [Candidatus Micrarchaeota archaeon]
ALENFNMAILLNPLFSEAYFSRALTYYKLKEYDKSIEDYAKASDYDPKNPTIFNNRGDCYYRKQDYMSAIKDYDKAAMLNPAYMKAYYNRGLCYASLEQYEKAIEDFTKVIELKPDFAEAFHLRGISSEYSGDVESAINDYKKALELKPTLSEAKAHLDAAKSKQEGGGGEGGEGKAGSDIKMVETPKINFIDVAGMEKTKEEIRRSIVYPMMNPDLAREYGKLGGGGIILYGPPGCGKTFIVKAAAGESKANFVNAKLSDLLDMYVGNTEKNIHKTFELSRKHAPCLLFFDEVEAIGARRDQQGGPGGSQSLKMAVNQMLYEMDGVETHNDNVLILAATNAPWDVDPALRRSGRFSRALYIPEPDLKSRMSILKLHAKKVPIEKRIPWFRLGLATEGYASADMKAIVEKAAEIPWMEAFKGGKKRKVRTGDFIAAIKDKKSSLPPWYAQANNQIGKQKEVTYIDGKKHIKETESKLGPEEREQFDPLLKVIKRRNAIWSKALTFIMKQLGVWLPIPF